MRTGRPKAELHLSDQERDELEKLRRSPRTGARLAQRAAIILDCAQGMANGAVASARKVSPLTVGKWRSRFIRERLPGLQDAPRPGKPRKRIRPERLKKGAASPSARKLASALPPDAENSQRRVTLQDIGRKLQFHFTTVSRALRRDPSLPAATRRKIEAAAREMGYQPDPNARAMAVYRNVIRPPSHRGTLMLLASAEVVGEKFPMLVLRAARQRAARLGYRIDVIESHAPGSDSRKLTRILKARGIAGLLVLPPTLEMHVPRRLRLDWSLFPAVTLGHGLFWPHLHRVDDDHFGNACQLTRRLIALGYRRIGLCMGERMAALRTGGGWEGGYLVEMKRLGECPSTYRYEPVNLDAAEIPALRSWILRERLDAVILDHGNSAILLGWRGGFRIPEELGIASLMSFLPGATGIHPPFERVWTTAVDFLVHLIHTHQRGIPEFPQRILLEGTWVPGKTVRRMNQGK